MISLFNFEGYSHMILTIILKMHDQTFHFNVPFFLLKLMFFPHRILSKYILYLKVLLSTLLYFSGIKICISVLYFICICFLGFVCISPTRMQTPYG